jgi:uncharacterized tellurite resistance protein B-like protein
MIDLKDFTEDQRQALLDLAMLAMYADGHLATVEDERVRRLLEAMPFSSEDERNRHYDASVARVSGYSMTAESAGTMAATLAERFANREQRQAVHGLLVDLVMSDSCVSPQEGSFISVVRAVLQR